MRENENNERSKVTSGSDFVDSFSLEFCNDRPGSNRELDGVGFKHYFLDDGITTIVKLCSAAIPGKVWAGELNGHQPGNCNIRTKQRQTMRRLNLSNGKEGGGSGRRGIIRWSGRGERNYKVELEEEEKEEAGEEKSREREVMRGHN